MYYVLRTSLPGAEGGGAPGEGESSAPCICRMPAGGGRGEAGAPVPNEVGPGGGGLPPGGGGQHPGQPRGPRVVAVGGAVAVGRPVLLLGGAGVGETALVREQARRTGR